MLILRLSAFSCYSIDSLREIAKHLKRECGFYPSHTKLYWVIGRGTEEYRTLGYVRTRLLLGE